MGEGNQQKTRKDYSRQSHFPWEGWGKQGLSSHGVPPPLLGVGDGHVTDDLPHWR